MAGAVMCEGGSPPGWMRDFPRAGSTPPTPSGPSAPCPPGPRGTFPRTLEPGKLGHGCGPVLEEFSRGAGERDLELAVVYRCFRVAVEPRWLINLILRQFNPLPFFSFLLF